MICISRYKSCLYDIVSSGGGMLRFFAAVLHRSLFVPGTAAVLYERM